MNSSPPDNPQELNHPLAFNNPPDFNNPLLQPHFLPPFQAIKAEHVMPAIQQITQENLQQLEAILEAAHPVCWDNLAAPLEALNDRLGQAWSSVAHLNMVKNHTALRDAYNHCLPLISDYYTHIGQHQALCQAYQNLADSELFAQMSQAQQQTIKHALRDFKLAGVQLANQQKIRYGEIQNRLSELSNQFSNNVLDATQGWFKHITDEAQLAGLPTSAVALAKQTAQNKNLPGWALTLDGSVFVTVLSQADDADLRREFYYAYSTRASDQGPKAGEWDNTALIEEILTLRQELAHLLGFKNYAELSIEAKMAESTQQVLDYIHNIVDAVKPKAQQEVLELQNWVQTQYGCDHLNVWDINYYSEKYKQARYQVSQEALRVYFPLPKVLSGLFNLLHQLFNVDIYLEDGADTWHADVQFYRVERDGKPIAYFYLDVYAREHKRDGAWMDDCRVRRQTASGLQLPVAFLVCNFNAPVGNNPSLLTHREVTTLFHEFGHGFHHMLTKMDVAAVSGINGVAWDAVELPSQFLENWCWQPEVLTHLTAHYQTGEPLPEASIQNLLAARNFQAAMMMVRQMEFALFDFKLHMDFGKVGFVGVQALLNQVRQQVSVVVPPPENRFQHSFTHIFAGGYSAGYYSYSWAEVLSADAFSAFEEVGLFDAKTAQKYREEILEKGGSEDAMVLFKRFRGREPDIQALLRSNGVAA